MSPRRLQGGALSLCEIDPARELETLCSQVVSVLDELVKLNPTPFPARSSALLGLLMFAHSVFFGIIYSLTGKESGSQTAKKSFIPNIALQQQLLRLALADSHTLPFAVGTGNWRQINAPEYPDGLGRDEGTGEFRYTLGRLSFNIFEPKDLVCNIGATLNPLSAVEGSEEIDYKITVPLSFEASGKRVRGELVNTASCAAESDERVCVRFTGGTLRCVDTADIDAWKAMFGKGEAEEEAASKLGWRKRVTTWLLNRLLGLQPPGPMDEDGSMSYSMSRSPKGFLEVLFVDDELRITRGNKGSLVIAERIPSA
eukprot:6023830-Pleurochrysis_carterae.AAC.2